MAWADEGCGATKTNSTLWTWGNNQAGELGHSNKQVYSSPRQVAGFTDAGFLAGHEKAFNIRGRTPQ